METILNIHIDIYEKISRAALSNGISLSELIVHLFKIVMNNISNPTAPGKMVQYQKKSMPDEWYTLHVSLRADDYKYFLDLKKLLEMSVPLIFVYAVKKYLHLFLKKHLTDNYQNKIIIRQQVLIDK